MRGKKAFLNTAVALLLEFVTVVCGFIVPRLIIGVYGSEVNGLTASIAQFLSYIALIEAGVGGVVKAALYKPLADSNYLKINGIIKATESFFRKIAYIFIGYMVILACIYPLLVNRNFDWWFTASLVIIIGISTFAQYYYGITYSFLIQADQKKYVISGLQIITIILNTLAVVLFVYFGASIQLLKLITSFVFILRPIILNIYVRKKYRIDKTVKPDYEAIKQRWDGFGHHIAFFVNLNTDVVILTLFSKLSSTFSISEVSVYSVYYSVVYGVEKLATSISSGAEAALGNMIAKNETENLNIKFGLYEFVSFAITTVLFTCAGILILPFMRVYTSGITDAEYVRPVFAYIMILAHAVYSIRAPYNNLTFAAGHYKQTRNGAFTEAGINIVISMVFVYFFGIIGVAIGTLIAMTFRTIQYASYLSKHILKRSMWMFVKRVVVSAISVSVSIFIAGFISSPVELTYLSWTFYAIKVSLVVVTITCIVNFALSKKDFMATVSVIYKTLFSRIKKKI